MILLSLTLIIIGMCAWLITYFDIERHNYNFAYKPKWWFVLCALIFAICFISGIALLAISVANAIG